MEEGNSGAACSEERQNKADRRQEHHCGCCKCDGDLRKFLNRSLSEPIDRHRKDADNNWADPIERISCRWQRAEHPALSCRSCRPNAPFAELVRLSRTSIADEMRIEQTRRVLGE
jgi:hypothetical protein